MMYFWTSREQDGGPSEQLSTLVFRLPLYFCSGCHLVWALTLAWTTFVFSSLLCFSFSRGCLFYGYGLWDHSLQDVFLGCRFHYGYHSCASHALSCWWLWQWVHCCRCHLFLLSTCDCGACGPPTPGRLPLLWLRATSTWLRPGVRTRLCWTWLMCTQCSWLPRVTSPSTCT